MATTTIETNGDKEWTPESENDVKLKAALETVLVTSPKSVITRSPDGQSNRFILQTHGYQDLYLYVTEGIKFEDSVENFEKTYARKSFAKVHDIDAGAYDQLRDTTINIALHCKDFNKTGLGRLTIAANGAVSFAEYAVGLLKEKKDISLYDALQVLLDKKYQESDKDRAYEEALETAQLAVMGLRESAQDNAKDTKEMIDLLHNFLLNTINDHKAVQIVKQNWITGPLDPVTGKRKLTSDGKEQIPYGSVLSAEVQRLQNEITLSTINKNLNYDEWKKSRKRSIGMAVAGIFVWWVFIGTGVEAFNAGEAKAEYDRLVAKIVEDNKDMADVVKALELERALANHFEVLLPKMETALKALTELHALFQEQDLNFKNINNYLASLARGVGATGWAARKAWIENAIDQAVETFTEIKELGQEFSRGAVPEIIPF
ncbi:hypothetical protein GGS20DRAFT_350031 [Poronia punctata]|nr:hypothetical protein GGS20DRAFT_350031 [Poronia punctata]